MPMFAKPLQALALVLMIWTVNLSVLASQGLEEAMHHHEAGAPCAHALLIDLWFQAAGLTAVTWPASVPGLAEGASQRRVLPQLALQNRGNRDPPIALS
ncbi:hypothetical protein [Ferrimonas sp.]|uniref:hypothetical protein n=1 Tax=Ferrimonas sp. TaxID=2080861 RepID=UPI003A8E9E83